MKHLFEKRVVGYSCENHRIILAPHKVNRIIPIISIHSKHHILSDLRSHPMSAMEPKSDSVPNESENTITLGTTETVKTLTVSPTGGATGTEHGAILSARLWIV